MGRLLTLTFTMITGFCALLSFVSFIHFIWGVNQNKKGKSVDSLVKKCAFVSLFGYTTFVIISFALYLIQTLYYFTSISINYSTLICQMQTFNIVFFMMGKLGMYFYFMSLVHVAFRGSFLAYPIKVIGSMAICFFFLMCVIGGFYMVFLYIDFSSVGVINSPYDCDKFEASKYSIITIWSGATCDAIWSFTCLLLFYLRLRKITKLMTKQRALDRKATDDMLEKIKLKRGRASSSTSLNELDFNPSKTTSENNNTTNTVINTVIHNETNTGEKDTNSNIISNAASLAPLNELDDDDCDDISLSTTASTTPPPQHKSDGSNSTSDMVNINRTNINTITINTTLSIAPDGCDNRSMMDDQMDPDESSIMTMSVSGGVNNTFDVDDDTSICNSTHTQTQTESYTLMKYKYQNAPRIVAYDSEIQSPSNKMFVSLKKKFDNTSNKIKKKIVRRNSWSAVRKCKAKKKPDIVHKFLPIMLKLSILSAWCAFSTFGLGFGLWTLYPTLSSVIDSTINGCCVYLSFGFTKPLYELLCLPFISCKNCENYRNVVNEANKMEKDQNFDTRQNVLG